MQHALGKGFLYRKQKYDVLKTLYLDGHPIFITK